MRLAILADVHGNVEALRAVLADVEGQGVDGILLGGDYALMGPRPGEAVEILRGLGARAIYGNTERLLFDEAEDPLAAWTREDVGAEGLAWLDGLPFEHRVEDLLLVHATPTDVWGLLVTEPNPHMPFEVTPEEEAKKLLGDARADLIVYGHIHWASAGTVAGQRVVSVGAVGFPSDGDRRAAYGIATLEDGRWALEHRRVLYDVEKVIAEIRASGTAYAEARARRLETAGYCPLEG